ncbi:uncharacterized protein LOC106162896 [Lingula anatina]|uniref:Nucleoporin NUP42 n=1 Tax=Lingula anatina TaxID=7574 RepID=A0A1S3IC53_LINAN|nr:uncharacterized protein LOC106162896 [Lingula anatina]XP_013395902.1 uncharacterized protein LOC106162896 [Lingula anatina]|eukprot:XP_013395822.1 uncharacterized protein LOC106162896 [Lingula anatina]
MSTRQELVQKQEKSGIVSVMSQASDPSPISICQFYANKRWCKFGKRCKFQHTRGSQPFSDEEDPTGAKCSDSKVDSQSLKEVAIDNATEGTDQSELETAQVVEVSSETEKPHKLKPKVTKENAEGHKICKFFARTGRCRFGSRCYFFHERSSGEQERKGVMKENVESADADIKEEACVNVQSRNPPRKESFRPPYRPSRPKLVFLMSELSLEKIEELRNSEILYLKKRFPRVSRSQVELTEGETVDEYRIEFTASDPDWPFDVKSLELTVSFPLKYPQVPFNIKFPEDQTLPDTVRSYVSYNVKGWIEETWKELQQAGKAELLLRRFLKWLDKKMEEFFTEGLKQLKRQLAAKAAGLEFIPFFQLQGSQSQDIHTSREPEPGEEEPSHMSPEHEVSEQEVDSGDGNVDKENKDIGAESEKGNLDPVKKGTEIRLLKLQLLEDAATLLGTKIKIIIQCSRCKNLAEIVTPQNQLNAVPCPKCASCQYVTFRPSLAHQMSSVIGYLDLQGCVAFDLVLADCVFSVGCMNCSKEMKLEGLAPGQMSDTRCLGCYSKLKVAVEAVKFQQLHPANITDTHGANVIVVKKAPRAVKDPAIQEGKPLPETGTCKHYRKSFRWLRFPCCGKCYPCDVCHDDKEGDHEMKFANRMVCGFCAKEQPYSNERPCISCHSHLKKVSTKHWEGGKGCRDKIAMSRDDKKKYANSSKTISKKQQALDKPGNAKTTKLRHT